MGKRNRTGSTCKNKSCTWVPSERGNRLRECSGRRQARNDRAPATMLLCEQMRGGLIIGFDEENHLYSGQFGDRRAFAGIQA